MTQSPSQTQRLSPSQFVVDSEPIPCPIVSQSAGSNHSNMTTDRLLAEIELAYERDEGVGASGRACGDSRIPTITYEEAIEREQEYKKRKIFSSLQPPAYASSLPKPSCELAPNPSLTGEKRKEISGSQYIQAQQHLSLNQQRQQNNTQGQQPLGQGQQYRQPQTHLSLNEQPLQRSTQFRKSHFWCNVCQVNCASSTSLKIHRQERMHRGKLEEIHRGKKNSNTQMLWCKECNILCMNAMSLAEHHAGKKHIATIQARMKIYNG